MLHVAIACAAPLLAAGCSSQLRSAFTPDAQRAVTEARMVHLAQNAHAREADAELSSPARLQTTSENAQGSASAGSVVRAHAAPQALTEADALAYWTHPGSDASPFNIPLAASERLAAAPPRFADLQINLSSWFEPASSPALWRATTADPQVRVLFNSSNWFNTADGVWGRQNNSASLEQTILATSSGTYPIKSRYGLYGKYYYSTTTLSHGGWVPPSPPRLLPQVAPPIFGLKVYAPKDAVPANDSDGYFAIFQPDGTVFECYSGIVLSSGTIVCNTYNITHSWSDLRGSEGGVMASTVPVYAGLVRQSDIDSGVIAHALNICLSPTQLKAAYISPAVSFDRDPGYSGQLPMGSRLAIPLTVDLSQHAFQSRVGAIIAHASQRYGAFVLDRGGPNGFTIRAEKNMTDPAFTHAWDWYTQQDLDWILSQLRVVQP